MEILENNINVKIWRRYSFTLNIYNAIMYALNATFSYIITKVLVTRGKIISITETIAESTFPTMYAHFVTNPVAVNFWISFSMSFYIFITYFYTFSDKAFLDHHEMYTHIKHVYSRKIGWHCSFHINRFECFNYEYYK